MTVPPIFWLVLIALFAITGRILNRKIRNESLPLKYKKIANIINWINTAIGLLVLAAFLLGWVFFIYIGGFPE
jgi:hypothetical protein